MIIIKYSYLKQFVFQYKMKILETIQLCINDLYKIGILDVVPLYVCLNK